jgi:opacity protein-like surface antigen
MENKAMKSLLAAVVLATLVASPALAQSYDPDIGTGNLDAAPYASNESYPVQHRTARRPAGYNAVARSTEFTPALGSVYHWPKYSADGRLINGSW